MTFEGNECIDGNETTFRKHAYSNIVNILTSENENFSDKKFW